MAKLIFSSVSISLLLLILSLSFNYSTELQPSQYQTILQIQQLLDYPSALSTLQNTSDLCGKEPTPSLDLVCFEDNITQLHITGDNGFPPLPQSFSSEAFFTTFVALPSLKVLSLASLGLRGRLPGIIGQLSSLEILDLSSNNFWGDIPGEVSALRSLQTLVLDHNNFTGSVPKWLNLLQSLAVLSLKNNSLSGFLPDSLTSLEDLRILELSGNQVSGEVPRLCNLTNLQVLDLEGNLLGPHFPELPKTKRLNTLVLRKNLFQFGIPEELESYHQLKKFDVSLNAFVGPFLLPLLSLPMITYLDISGNKFTGELMENITCNPDLAFVNLSANLLTGDLPSCLRMNSRSKVVLYAGNCLSNGVQEQHPYPICINEAVAVRISPDNRKPKRSVAQAVVALSIVGGFVGGAPLLALAFLVSQRVYARKKVKKPPTRFIIENLSRTNTAKLLSDAKHIVQTMKIGGLALPPYKTFSLEELKEATNNFNDSTRIGDGTHGQIYRGKLGNGTLVVIRSLKMRKKQSARVYTHHIEMFSKLRHTNLVGALGHCFECHPDYSGVSRIFLIVEFVPNGNLRAAISGPQGLKLSWSQRIAAMVGVTKGIQFLHTGIVPGIYSNHLKITDVLLDHDLNVKIGRYNVPLLANTTVMMGIAVATPGPKENISANHQDKDDVYDIGRILLEIILGREFMSHNEVAITKEQIQASITADDVARMNIVDPAIRQECSNESLKVMMDISLGCLSDDPIQRPSVEDVLWNLQFAAQIQESWKTDYPIFSELQV